MIFALKIILKILQIKTKSLHFHSFGSNVTISPECHNKNKSDMSSQCDAQ